jgi:proliferating cell nuclear antigen PCNA
MADKKYVSDADSDLDSDSDSESEIGEDIDVFVKTTEIQFLKTVMECIKDVIGNVGLLVTENGIRLAQRDSSKTLIVDMFLEKDKFDEFICNAPNTLITINCKVFHKLIKITNKLDTLTLIKYKDDYNLNIEIKKNAYKTRSFCIVTRDENIERLDTVIDQRVSFLMSSDNFQEMCKDMNNVRECAGKKKLAVEYICSDGNITFEANIMGIKGKVDFQNIDENDNSSSREDRVVFVKEAKDDVIQGKFSLQHVNYFLKCCSMCKNVQIHIDNDKDFVLSFKFSLGHLNLFLKQKRNNLILLD